MNLAKEGNELHNERQYVRKMHYIQSRKEQLAQREVCKSSKELQAPSHHQELTVSSSHTKNPPLQVEKGQSEYWRS